MLQGREIILGITGCIAAYKAAEVLRQLVQREANVNVVMTRNAREFVAPLTFQTLSRNPVVTEMFVLPEKIDIKHISLARRAELILVAPTTANLIGKFAHGIADDFLTTMLLATRATIMLAPAMNPEMYSHSIVQENIATLQRRGVKFISPGTGETACQEVGTGRLAEVDTILEEVERNFIYKGDLLGKKILITAGPTQEPLDPVRFLSNHSSGKMGYALAEASRDRGAEVTLISGPSSLSSPANVTFRLIQTALEMREAVLQELPDADVVIKAAAVADYRPKVVHYNKLKKGTGEMTISLERNPDILAEIGAQKKMRILVGFAAETESLLANAFSKMQAKNLDLIVANNVASSENGFQSDYNQVILIHRDGSTEDLPRLPKREVANAVLDRVIGLLEAVVKPS